MKKIILLNIVLSTFNLFSQDSNIEDSKIEINAEIISIDYYNEAVDILQKFPNSKISPEILYESAIKTFEKNGIIVPVRLAIAQALIETNLGNAGTGHRNNPYSIYDNKHKRYRHYNSISEGVESYYDLISSKYLKNSSIDKLLKNFVNINNKRYAIDSRYESKLRKVYFSL